MIDTRASVRRAAPPSIWAATLSRRWRSRAVPNQVIYAQTQRLTGARIWRIEDVVLAHAYAPISMHIRYRQSRRRRRAKRLTQS
jgi:hypothetical protein